MYTVITKQRLKELDACEDGFKKFVKVNGGSVSDAKWVINDLKEVNREGD